MRLSGHIRHGVKKSGLLWCALILALHGCASSGALRRVPIAQSSLPPAPMTPGAQITDSWSYEADGALIVRDGCWVHLPAAEAGELLLWIEAAEKGR